MVYPRRILASPKTRIPRPRHVRLHMPGFLLMVFHSLRVSRSYNIFM